MGSNTATLSRVMNVQIGVEIAGIGGASKRDLLMIARSEPATADPTTLAETRADVTRLLRPLFQDARSDGGYLNLFGVTAETWADFFMAGRAALIVDTTTDRAVAFGRLGTRLSPEMILSMGIAPDCPTILESGNITTHSSARGQGLAPEIVLQLARMNISDMKSGRLVIISTMKEVSTAKIFKRAFIEEGMFPRFFDHLELPGIATLTCKCNPSNGTGFQIGNDASSMQQCAARINPHAPDGARIIDILNGPIDEYSKLRDLGNSIPCVLFVSDGDLASFASARILESAGTTPDPIPIVVDFLMKSGYYSG